MMMTTDSEMLEKLAATKRLIEEAQLADIELAPGDPARDLTRQAALHLVKACHLLDIDIETL
jgi:hypothetical protein